MWLEWPVPEKSNLACSRQRKKALMPTTTEFASARSTQV